jgi:molybdopterin synthase catalytic subunit
LERKANPVCKVLLTEAELELPADGGDSSAGAIVDFWGVVRDRENGRVIDGIEYEAHRPMAQHQLRLIGEQAIAKFGLNVAIVHHRLGFIAAGKPSLFVRVASRNRAEAFQASQWVVDELKRRVPIWKRPNFRIDNQTVGKVGFETEIDLASRG